MTLTAHQQQALKRRLLDERVALVNALDAGGEAAAVVELDQTRQGRLSRMDALQQQAMAKSGLASARARLAAVDAALARMAAGEYGDCHECGEAIASARLEVSPEARLCIGCMTRSEARS